MKIIYINFISIIIGLLWLVFSYLSGLASSYSVNSSIYTGKSLFLSFSYSELSFGLPILSIITSLIFFLFSYLTDDKVVKLFSALFPFIILIGSAIVIKCLSNQLNAQYLSERTKIKKQVQIFSDSFSKDYTWKSELGLGIKEDFITLDVKQNCLISIFNRYFSLDFNLIAKIDTNNREVIFRKISDVDEKEIIELFKDYVDQNDKTIFDNFNDYRIRFETKNELRHCDLTKYNLDLYKDY